MGAAIRTAVDERAPRKRIFEAAIDLFASKGYAGTGVREIASRADVNQAAINYYFGSKLMILEEITEELFQSFSNAFSDLFDNDLSDEERLRLYLEKLVQVLRQNPRKARILLRALFLDIPDFTEFKAKKIQETFLPLVQRLTNQKIENLGVILPAIIGMVSFHFMTVPVFEEVTGIAPDEAFYRSYQDKITNLALFGLIGKPG